ncbi:hypothetical protein LXL04_005934 [Taraxacum kok-saghyz]
MVFILSLLGLSYFPQTSTRLAGRRRQLSHLQNPILRRSISKPRHSKWYTRNIHRVSTFVHSTSASSGALLRSNVASSLESTQSLFPTSAPSNSGSPPIQLLVYTNKRRGVHVHTWCKIGLDYRVPLPHCTSALVIVFQN